VTPLTEQEYLTDRLTIEAESFIEKNKKKPFCLYLSHYAVHGPWESKDEYREYFEGKRKPGAPHDNAVYAGMIKSLDDSVGRLVAKVKELGLDETCGELMAHLEKKGVLDNTLIVYICDNGWAAKSTRTDDSSQKNWNQYALRSKTSPYENGIRTPIILSWPGKVKPKNDPNLAHSIDLFPTIAAAAGLEAPAGLPGIDLLDEQTCSEREIIFGSVHATHNMTVGNPDDTLQYLWGIEGDWKLLIRYHGKDTTKFKSTHDWDTKPIRLYN
jgi:arylsulfatase A-like enzyme